MGPGIGRSIRAGFRSATRGWAGIGLTAVTWIVVALVGTPMLILTSFPWDALVLGSVREARAALVQGSVPGAGSSAVQLKDKEPSASTEPAPEGEIPAAKPTATEESVVTKTAQDPDLFKRMSQTEAPVVPADEAATRVSPQLDTGGPANTDRERRNRLIADWLGHAWPVALLLVLLFAAANVWLNGAQIGYLGRLVTAGAARASDFFGSATRAFVNLLGAGALSLLGGAVLLIVGALAVWLASALSSVLPGWVAAVFGIVGLIAALVGIFWLAIRLSFWFIEIVVGNVKPIAGLKASFRVTRGRGWHILGLIGVMTLIAIGVSLPLWLLNWAGGLMGGIAGIAMMLIGALARAIANLYISFAALAAMIRYYEDAKALPPRAASVPQ